MSQLRDTLGGCDQASLEMHLEVVIERIWRYTLESRDQVNLEIHLDGCDHASLEMHLEAVIECTWRYTHEGRDRVNLEIHLEAVIERSWRRT